MSNKRLLNPAPDDRSPLAELTGNISHCWRCSHCKWTPSPKSNAFAHACPSIQWGQFHAYSGGGKVITAFALKEGEAQYTETALQSVFACTMCGACDTSCKTNNAELVEPLSILYALRAHIAQEGHSLPVHLQMRDNLRQHGNALGRPRNERSLWSEGLALKDALAEQVDVLLLIGCDYAFDQALWPELHAIVRLLRSAGVDFGVAHAAEVSTGEGAYDLGFQDDARELATQMAQVIARSGARQVVSFSASSFAGIRNIWPRLGLPTLAQPILHVTEFIDDLFEAGRLTLLKGEPVTVTYHDPCKLGRLSEQAVPSDTRWTKVLNTMSVHEAPKQVLFGNDGVYEPPRRLLERVAGLQLVEMDRNRVGSYCCGGAGGAPEAFPDFARFAAQNRLDEARSTGAEVLATACGGCRRHLADVASATGGNIRVMGLFEILAGCVDVPVQER